MTQARGSSRPARRTRAWLVGLVVSALLIGAAAWAAHAVTLQRALERLHEAAQRRLVVEAGRLDVQLSRFEYLPPLLETSTEVLRLLGAPGDRDARVAVSAYLKSLNAIAGADNLYVLSPQGVALAAADDGQPGTPVGQDLSYRPYLREALANGRGAFYGVGVTSRRAGYYLSYALPTNGDVRGVATVKVNLESLEDEWAGLAGELLLVDEHRVVILASHADWKYRPLAPLSAEERSEAAQARRYGDASLGPLDWRVGDRIDAGAQRVAVGGRPFLVSEHAVNRGRWRLLLVDDEAPARAAARLGAVSAALAAAVLLLALTVAQQRRRAIRLRLANREALQAAHDSLERKVQERTAELQAAQAELVHAGRLALLGQMSAGMTHELNQPLAALRTLADNTALLIDRGRHDDAKGNLQRIAHLVGRLARLTRQLKVFAHRSDEPPGSVVVQSVVTEAQTLLAERLRDGGVELRVAVEPAELRVAGDAARLEQVFVNLLGNAIDAMEASSEKRIDVEAQADDAQARIVVRNTGPAIDPAILERLFQPFVSSKPAGKGLGLGLMISQHIVEGFGGRIEARNLDAGGVEFAVRLPRAHASARSSPATVEAETLR